MTDTRAHLLKTSPNRMLFLKTQTHGKCWSNTVSQPLNTGAVPLGILGRLTLTIEVFPTPGAPRTTTLMSGRLTSSSNLGLGAPAGEPPQVLPGPPLPLPPPGARPEGPPGLKLPAAWEAGGPTDILSFSYERSMTIFLIRYSLNLEVVNFYCRD